MKLTSRYLKPGDKIIRKSPNKNGDCGFMTTVCEISKKNRHHIEVATTPYSGSNTRSISILDHFTWNDNEWVRYK